VGTKLKEFQDIKTGKVGNFRLGKAKYLIIEADEWQASFLNYWPKIIVLTNIEKEHLDYFKDLEHILEIYGEYISHLPGNGALVVNKEDQNIKKLLEINSNEFLTIVENLVYYSLRQKEAERMREILKIPGDHNVSNALAALTVARVLKIPDEASFQTLSEYKGAWRRFEEKTIHLEARTCKLISDYGHHPTEIRVTLQAAREKFPKKKIWVVFQPHQYQRTYYLFDDFVKVFKESPIDKLIIVDIYDVAGREEKKIKEGVSSEKLIKAIKSKKALYIPTIEKTANFLKENLRGREVVMIMGAGDIYKLCDLF